MSSDFSPDPGPSPGPWPPQEPNPQHRQQPGQDARPQNLQPPAPPQPSQQHSQPQPPPPQVPPAQHSQQPRPPQSPSHEPTTRRDARSAHPSYVFRMPPTWPRRVNDVAPSGGMKSVFSTAHMPLDARIGYWVNLVVCALSIILSLFTLVALTAAVLFSVGAMGVILFFLGPWAIFFMFAYLIFALVMSTVQLTVTLKIREGSEWARLVLSVLAVAGVLLGIVYSAASSDMVDAGGLSWTDIATLLTAAVFWLPKSNAWFISTPEPGTEPARH